MVTCIATGNFDYGVSPVTPPAPYLTDIAVGVRKDTNQGEMDILIR
jgi:hypothetical protein